MSLFDGLIPTYAFHLQIERSDRTIIDTTIIAKATADEIARAKRTVQRLLTEYTPTIKAPEQVPTPPPESDTPALPEPEAQDPAADQRQDEPAEAAAPPRAPPRYRQRSRREHGDCFASAAQSAVAPSEPTYGTTRPRYSASADTTSTSPPRWPGTASPALTARRKRGDRQTWRTRRSRSAVNAAAT